MCLTLHPCCQLRNFVFMSKSKNHSIAVPFKITITFDRHFTGLGTRQCLDCKLLKTSLTHEAHSLVQLLYTLTHLLVRLMRGKSKIHSQAHDLLCEQENLPTLFSIFNFLLQRYHNNDGGTWLDELVVALLIYKQLSNKSDVLYTKLQCC